MLDLDYPYKDEEQTALFNPLNTELNPIFQ